MIQTTMKAPVLYGPHFGWAIGHVTFRSVFHRVTTMPTEERVARLEGKKHDSDFTTEKWW